MNMSREPRGFIDRNIPSENYRYEHEDYELVYVDKDRDNNKLVTVKPEIAKESVRNYLEEQIGKFLDGEFNITNDKINKKFTTVSESLNGHIDRKIDDIAEKIMTKMVSSNFEKAVSDKVNEKLAKFKMFLDEEEENNKGKKK